MNKKAVISYMTGALALLKSKVMALEQELEVTTSVLAEEAQKNRELEAKMKALEAKMNLLEAWAKKPAGACVSATETGL